MPETQVAGGRLATDVADGQTPELELLLGDPHDDGPFGFAAIIDDDNAQRLNPWAETVLDEWSVGAEFVPETLGGRWGDTAQLVTRLRPVFRRDPALGVSCVSSLMAAADVWVAGSEPLQAEIAGRLLAGERIAVAPFAPSAVTHPIDLPHMYASPGVSRTSEASRSGRGDCWAEFDGEGWRLTGQQLILNVGRAESVLVTAQTGETDDGTPQFSLLLWRPSAESVADTGERVLTVGMRGGDLRAVRFEDTEASLVAHIGAAGAAQIGQAVIPALAVGAVETALHESVRYARARALYGATVLDIPAARSLFANALADTLIADALSATAVRTLHIAPAQSAVVSAAAKQLASQLLTDTMQQVAVLVSSTFYARVEPFGIIEKLVRDLDVVPLLQPSGPASLIALLSQLPTWAEHAETTEQTDLRLFDSTDTLPPLDFTAFALQRGGDSDPLGAALHDIRIREAMAAEAPNLEPLVSELAEGLERERALARALPPDQLTAATAPAEAFDLAERIALLLAAGAVVGAWMAARGTDGVAADPLVIEACLRRLGDRLARHRHPLDHELVDRLVAHAEARVAESRSMGLDSVPVYRA